MVYWTVKRQARLNNYRVGVVFGSPTGEFFEETEKLGVSVFSPHWERFHHFQNFQALRQFLREFHILHYHTFNPWLSLAGILEKKRIVATIHSVDLYQHMYARQKPFKHMQGWFLRYFADQCTVVSNYCKLHATRAFGVPEEELNLIYNGVDFAELDHTANPSLVRKDLQIPDDCKIIGTVSVLESHKRLEKLLEVTASDYLFITRGEEGMTLFEGKEHSHIPTVAREVFDVTGAGDTVIASLTLAVAAGASIRDAAL